MPHIRRFRGKSPKQKAKSYQMVERQVQVLDLLSMGMNPKQIGQQLGVSPATVHKDYVTALQKLEALRLEMGKLYYTEQLQRLEFIWAKLQPQIGPDNTEVTNTALRVLEQRDRLLALSPKERGGDQEFNLTVVYNGVNVPAAEMARIASEQMTRQLPPGGPPDVVEAEIVPEVVSVEEESP